MVLPRLIFPVQLPSMIRCVAEDGYDLEIEIETNIGNGEDIPEDATIGKWAIDQTMFGLVSLLYNTPDPSAVSMASMDVEFI